MSGGVGGGGGVGDNGGWRSGVGGVPVAGLVSGGNHDAAAIYERSHGHLSPEVGMESVVLAVGVWVQCWCRL